MDVKGYFDDLDVTNVEDRHFNGSYVHHQSSFKTDTFSLEMIAEGEVYLKLDKDLLLLKAPVVFCTGDNNKFYRFYYTSDQKNYRHLWIDFNGERGRRIYSAFLRLFPFGQVPLSEETASEVLAVFKKAEALFHRQSAACHDPLVLLMEQLVCLCLSGQRKSAETPPDPFRLSAVCKTVLQDPFKEHALKEFAAERNISQVYLRKLFLERYKITLNRFIFKARMEMAAELLSTGQYRVGELADLCKFSEISAFTRAFRRMFGETPSAFSRQKKLPGIDHFHGSGF